ILLPILLGAIFLCIISCLIISPFCCCLVCGVKPVLATLGIGSFDPPKQPQQVNKVTNQQPNTNIPMDQTLPVSNGQQEVTQQTTGQSGVVQPPVQINEVVVTDSQTPQNHVPSQ